MKPKLFINDKLVQPWEQFEPHIQFTKECRNPIKLQIVLDDGQKLDVWADKEDLKRCGVYRQDTKNNEETK